jgi:hypothetical protein
MRLDPAFTIQNRAARSLALTSGGDAAMLLRADAALAHHVEPDRTDRIA